MIIELEKAKKLDPNISQEDLDGLENMIRSETNNKFQLLKVRKDVKSMSTSGEIVLNDVVGLFVGDTVELSYSTYDDGLYVISDIQGNSIAVSGDQITGFENVKNVILTKIKYPSDIVSGVTKLISYNAKMHDKVGVKSETVARMSKTYYDVSSQETWNGYPKSLMAFIRPYRKVRF
ncbi:hypothetical protein [Erysipelothrix anatis]|uniref:hypothetical protein n=1 Tax=Erysipelothrix anatis TaxID=2683713 RepID=UPI00140A3637|nr:hypothetical protein [Erysipelothrix anatis]